MARKASANSESSRGFYDIIGIVFMCFAALLLAALLSYHPRDVSANALPPNPSVHNWIGPFGAWLAYGCFLTIGASAFVLPVLLFFVGLGCFFDAFAYLRRRWAWALILLVCCMGMLDLYREHLGDLERNLGVTAGGVLGRNLNQHLCGECFGTVGATIIFLMLYFISLLFLTNFQLGEWVRRIWARRASGPGAETSEEATLERRSRDLQKQTKTLQEQVDRSGLGADGKPVPAPTVRDLSVAQPSKGAKAKKPAPPEPVTEPAPAEEVEVIPAHEVAAATVGDILGKKSGSTEKPGEAKPGDGEPAPEAKPEPEVHIIGLQIGRASCRERV